ncbi:MULTISPECIES: hypothetical protein [Enterobacteriaceae]|uniref:hypothetical protein n=1 Tax=Enterobacteriaceae TaxID=543 RepID=UPI00133010FF|nr:MULTISPECIES: hypothetical protein [Enterobacteriaceae]
MIILSEIETLEQLKKKGPFNKVKASINEIIPIKARGWDHLWAKILELRIYAKCNDIFRTANLLRIKDISLIKKYLWLVTATRRKYNLYISFKYEGIDYFKSGEVCHEI